MTEDLCKSNYLKVLFFFALLSICLMFAVNPVQASSGSYNNGEWRMRYDTTFSKYGCSAAPTGTVTGKHINLIIRDKRGRTINNLHIWLGYLPTIYISDGAFCAKMDKTTWKKMFEKIESFLKRTMSTKSIKSLVNSLEGTRFTLTSIIILPNCNNTPKWDIYSRLVCKGMEGTYTA